MIDDFAKTTCTANSGRLGTITFLQADYHPHRLAGDVQHRTLDDGRRFEVIERFWQPDELTAYTAGRG